MACIKSTQRAALAPDAPYLAAVASPKRFRVSAAGDFSNGASGKRVGIHNSSFHCNEALGCFLIRLTSQFAGTDVVRTRDPHVELLAPAVTGTRNVLKACSEAKVKRVVLVSSISAVMMNPK